MNIEDAKQVMEFTLQAGALLLAAGMETGEVERIMESITNSRDLSDCQSDVTFTLLIVSLASPELIYPITLFRRVRRRTLDYTTVDTVFKLVKQFNAHQISVQEAMKQAKVLENSSVPFLHWQRLIGRVVTSAGSTMLLGATWQEIVLACLIVFPINWLKAWLDTNRVPSLFVNLLTAVLITVVTLIISLFPVNFRSNVVIAGSILILLPGATLVISAQEGIEGDLLSSLARGLESFLTGAAVAAGVGISLSTALKLGVPGVAESLNEVRSVVGYLPTYIIAAMLISVFFGIANGIPAFALPIAGAMGMAGWFIFQLAYVTSGGWAPFLSILAATIFVGFISRLIAAAQDISANLYIIPAIISLLPGMTIYKGMLAIAIGEVVSGLVTLIQAVIIGAVIATGVGLGAYLFSFFKINKNRPFFEINK